MQVEYTGPEDREFGGTINGQKFRVPVAKREDGKLLPRLVEFVKQDEEGNETVSTTTNAAVGDALILVTSDAPRPKDRKLVYAAYDPDKSRQGAQREDQAVTPAEDVDAQPGAHAGARIAQKTKG